MEDEREEEAATTEAQEPPAGKKKRDLRNDRAESEMRRQRFVDNVIDAKLACERTGEKVNYRQCALDAGYPQSTAKAMSYYLRNKPDVQAEVRMRLSAAGISDAEIVGFPASVIKYSLADVVDFFPDGSWHFNPHKAIKNGAISVVKSLGKDARGNDKVEMYDKLKASDLLASIRGLKRADVKPDDLALRRMVIEDDIRAFREKMLIQTGGNEALADQAADQYRADLRRRPEYAPYMDDAVDRTRETDPLQ